MLKLTPVEWDQIINDPKMRKLVAKSSHLAFYHIYFSHYTTYHIAFFQEEMFRMTETDASGIQCVIAFRGSGKSTYNTLSYPIYAITGSQQKKFIVIVSQTNRQARQHLMNIRRELEANELLRADLGPFSTIDDEWGAHTLEIAKYGARITIASMEQTIRGMRHLEHRPDLIICDDIEDISSTKTREGRDRLWDWVTGEIIPAGTPTTKYIFVGNKIHEDCVMMRLKKRIESGETDGHILEVPIVDDLNRPTWPGKYPDDKAIEAQRKLVMNEVAWQREYMLQIIPEDSQIILKEWIQYYDKFPGQKPDTVYRLSATGVDLAISINPDADYTAMLSGHLYGYQPDWKVYLCPNPIYEHLTMHEIIEKTCAVSKELGGGIPTKLFIEDVAFQKAVVQELIRLGYPAEGIKVNFGDKRDRLIAVSYLVQSGRILFPKTGTEKLIEQLVYFGTEKHDDLADAFAILLYGILGMNHKRREFGIAVGNLRHIGPSPYLNPYMTNQEKADYYKRLKDRIERMNTLEEKMEAIFRHL